MASDSFGKYLPHMGVVGHEMIFGGEPFTAHSSRGLQMWPHSGDTERVFGARNWSILEGATERRKGAHLLRPSSLPGSLVARTRVVVITNASVFTIPVTVWDGIH